MQLLFVFVEHLKYTNQQETLLISILCTAMGENFNMFIIRDFSRTEHDDFLLNVEDHIRDQKEAITIYNQEGNIIGWKIQDMYE